MGTACYGIYGNSSANANASVCVTGRRLVHLQARRKGFTGRCCVRSSMHVCIKQLGFSESSMSCHCG